MYNLMDPSPAIGSDTYRPQFLSDTQTGRRCGNSTGKPLAAFLHSLTCMAMADEWSGITHELTFSCIVTSTNNAMNLGFIILIIFSKDKLNIYKSSLKTNLV